MDSENVSAYFGGFFTAAIIFIIVLIVLAPTSTPATREIIHTVQHSTNIVEALKKEHLIIRDVNHGTDGNAVKIVVEYDFLYKNSKRK